MPDNDPKQLERIFNLAFDAPAEQRAAILERECAGDVELRREVEAMLAGAEDSRFLASPADATWDPQLPLHASESSIALPIEQPGTRIGPYKLLQQIGEGGFGAVFMAEQEKPVARKVALKIIKLGMDTRQVVARFEQERQALALMDHPHVARVFDAGSTETGRPYFVMELCTGEAITEYCDKHNLSIRQRLELFAQVCQAVQHAHTKGLIHRDIKPNNVLVSTQDGRPFAKIIDFGIAKATASKLTEKTLFTEHRQLIGTPQYMSPEQAEGSLDIDTRTDVYSLGVLLYELLTGSTPFDGKSLRSAAYGEIQRIIREVDPPRPSTRLQQSSDTIASVAARRDIEPRKLGTIVRGELDWIVMKALEKDRQRRYESANALGADIQRHLAGEAVVAAPASKSYLLRKFVRRNKGPVAAASAVMIALAIGAVAFAWQAREARRQRDNAVVVARFVSNILSGAGPGVARGRDTAMLKEMMDEAAAKIDAGELHESPEAEVRLRGQIGNVYRELSLYAQAAKMLEPAIPLARATYRGDNMYTAEAIANYASLQRDRGDLAAAEPLFGEALDMCRRLFPGVDHPLTADTLNNLGLVVRRRGDLDGAEALYLESLAMWKRMEPGDNQRVALLENNLGNLMVARGTSADAETHLRASIEMNRRLFADHPVTAAALTRLAMLVQARGDMDSAEQLGREALEMARRLYGNAAHADLTPAVTYLGALYAARGDYARAEPLFVEALELGRKLKPGDSPEVANAMSNLAAVLYFQGRLDRSEQLMIDALAMRRRLAPGDSGEAAQVLIGLANNRRARGDLPAAERHAREAIEIMRRVAHGGDDANLAESLYTFGLVVEEQSDYQRAGPLFREALDMYRRLFKSGHPMLAVTQAELANVLTQQGDAAVAEPLARDAASMLDRLRGPNHRHTGGAHLRLGQALLKLNRFADAEAELTSAARTLTTAQGVPASRRQECLDAMVTLYETWDQSEPNKGHAGKAAEWRAKLQPATSEPTRSRELQVVP